ncbi:hypothetical protein BT93_K0331 [Corymbia citriodora subsp. variegata]|nr:hypothetical protein BT93_K0331 [Corymbia citriodora subsp. variegata]
MILSPPQEDHNPSMKFKSPERVTLLVVSSYGSFLGLSLLSLSTLSSSKASFSPFFFLCPVRSREQSMSSITMIDLLVVSINSFRSSVLSLTAVSSRSYTS